MSEETPRTGRGPGIGEGAALSAPTSPHATPPRAPPPGTKRKRSGPERFWDRRRVRLALAACFALSLLGHYAVSPWTVFPDRTLEIKDTDGELTIPIDLLEGEDTPPPPPPPPPQPAPPPPAPTATATAVAPKHPVVDASAPQPKPDAGAPRDAGVDAESASDAAAFANGTRPSDAASDAPLFAFGDGGLEGVTAGEKLVEVRVNIDVVKTNPVGARLGPLLHGIPQWDDFMAGTDVDPIADVDWIRIYGPSLIRTEKDAVIVHFNMTDARAARDITILSKHDVNGGAYDAGVPGVRAWRGHADRAWRVFMLPRTHVAVMVPPEKANETARVFSRLEPHLNMHEGEAVWIMVKNPSHPMPFLPTSLTELRFWATPRADGGADAFAEADAPDEESARLAARQIHTLGNQMNSLAVKLVTRGLLNDVEVTSEGSMVKVHFAASQEQLEALYDLVSAYLGVNAPPTAPSGAPSSAPSGLPHSPRVPR